jgi:hypothetical protein
MVAIRQTADELIPELARCQRQSLVLGGGLAAVSFVGLVLNPAQFYQSYLQAYLFVLGATLGCLALGMIHQLSGGAWGVVTRRLIGAASRVLPVLTVLFLPIVLGMHDLYHWTHEDAVATDPILQIKQPYLNRPFFLARAVAYFAVWNTIVYFLNKWSVDQDRTGDPRIGRRMQVLSGGGLVAFGLTVTFASFDWIMSLDPHWYSTIFGILTLGGQGLTALAVLIVALAWLSRRPPLNTVVVPSHFHDLGNLMLAFVMLWAYFSFSQYLIIYSANLPEEITWYVRRLFTGWRFIGVMLVVFHFAVPFAVLLSRRVKREPQTLLKVAIGILVLRAVDLFWLIAPELHRDGFSLSWLDPVLLLALSAIWIGCFMYQLRGRAILPVYDPQFREAVGGAVGRATGAH